MNLQQLLSEAAIPGAAALGGSTKVDITHIAEDSRQSRPGAPGGPTSSTTRMPGLPCCDMQLIVGPLPNRRLTALSLDWYPGRGEQIDNGVSASRSGKELATFSTEFLASRSEVRYSPMSPKGGALDDDDSH